MLTYENKVNYSSLLNTDSNMKIDEITNKLKEIELELQSYIYNNFNKSYIADFINTDIIKKEINKDNEIISLIKAFKINVNLSNSNIKISINSEFHNRLKSSFKDIIFSFNINLFEFEKDSNDFLVSFDEKLLFLNKIYKKDTMNFIESFEKIKTFLKNIVLKNNPEIFF